MMPQFLQSGITSSLVADRAAAAAVCVCVQWDFLGDWITPHGSESNITSPENLLFNNCYLSYITKRAADIATILGKRDVSHLLLLMPLSVTVCLSMSALPLWHPTRMNDWQDAQEFTARAEALDAAINTAFYNTATGGYVDLLQVGTRAADYHRGWEQVRVCVCVYACVREVCVRE
jgi:hypothetical protein